MEMNMKNESAKMLIKFYNMQAGCAVSASDKNVNMAISLLDANGEDVGAAKKGIRDWVAAYNGEGNIAYKFADCMIELASDARQSVKAEIEAKVASVGENEVQYSMGILEKAVVGLIAQTQAEKIEAEIMGNVEATVRNFIEKEYGTIERKVITVIDGKRREGAGIQHEKFDTVLKFVANNEPVFLTGPAGSGKNVICKQVAEALGLKFYFTNAVTQEYKLTGFTDAMGNYQPTQFYKAFTEGGVFMLDEMDASIPEVLVILNAAIANKYFDFPAPIGYVEAHPDFRVIAAGNTLGHGADFEYVGRNQLDAASLDRFAVVEIDYSKNIENVVANGDRELLKFCRKFRSVAIKSGLNVIVSYRAIGRLAKMKQILELTEALTTCMVRGLEKDDLSIIRKGFGGEQSQYTEALDTIIANM